MERPNIGPHETCLLLAGSNHVFHVMERDLDGSAIMPSKVDLGRAGTR
ncbi:unnamed protein product [Gemmata massiliana]|uniref:Uncharacterized protein n=1 Tax=Gemmata massiliana TaxID=1210884 RepID=A0A6P2CWI9_9BACT|nr:unnamed protein product [Gemmata massiliana]